MTENFLLAENIVKQYAKHKALNNVSITVPRGKVFGLLGPNGAGKTTLIRIINRITAPDKGQIIFDNHPFKASDVMQIGYLPEERGLYKKMKVSEQAIYLARLKGLTYSEAVKRLKEWFEKFNIMSWWDKRLEELSKGMQQKVQFIITVLHRPPLLIFDEPFSGFDPINAEMLKQEILKLRDEGHTVIFSTHNMSSVEEICDEIALINHAQVVLSGNVTQIKRNFRTSLFEVVSEDSTLASLEGSFTVEKHTETAGLHTYLLSKSTELTNSKLITAISSKIEPISIREKLPTMQEIFLKVVAKS